MGRQGRGRSSSQPRTDSAGTAGLGEQARGSAGLSAGAGAGEGWPASPGRVTWPAAGPGEGGVRPSPRRRRDATLGRWVAEETLAANCSPPEL